MRQIGAPRSTAERERDLAALGGKTWDLLVVGGGITGTAVARDAALRGLEVALIEQADFAFGTSSRSSRLVHGGLRYLASLDFGLVREGLVERRRLLDLAPGLVHPVEFVYPVYAGDPDPLWKVNLGVTLYELLSLGYGLGGRRRLRAAAVLRQVPGLRRRGLKGAVAYRDAATHDTRLTLAVALSAREAGALPVSRCGALELLRDGGPSERGGGPGKGGRVTGAAVEDRISGRSFEVAARAVVLCCGPWQQLFPIESVRLRTARGTHVSLPGERLPLASYVALRSPLDGRLAFAMPIDGYTVIGTTDQDDAVEPGSVRPTESDTVYLLELANHAFPGVNLHPADVAGVWAGLRPLVADKPGAHADEISREHQVAAPVSGLWILTGGKLTTHREMAEDCVDRIVPALARQGVRAGPCRTRRQPLLAGSLEEGRRELLDLGFEEAEVEALACVYGARLERLVGVLERLANGPPGPETLLDAEVELAAREEWALSLDDLLLRRIGPGQLDLKTARARAPRAAERLGELLGWSAEERRAQVEAFAAGIGRDLAAAGLSPGPGP